jgi:hypothetical protein
MVSTRQPRWPSRRPAQLKGESAVRISKRETRCKSPRRPAWNGQRQPRVPRSLIPNLQLHCPKAGPVSRAIKAGLQTAGHGARPLLSSRIAVVEFQEQA